QELPRQSWIAHFVRALAKEADPMVPDMKARAHAVAVFSGRLDRDARRQRHAGNSVKRVFYDRGLELQLAGVRNVAVETAAAERVAGGPSIGGRRMNRHRVGVRDAFRDALDQGGDLFAWNDAGHEDDLTVGASDHPAAGGGLFNRQTDRLTGSQHVSRKPI